MTTIANIYRQEGIEKGIEKGKLEASLKSAKEMLKDGIPLEKISQYVQIKIDKLKKLLEI